jgi:hypothetical protein
MERFLFDSDLRAVLMKAARARATAFAVAPSPCACTAFKMASLIDTIGAWWPPRALRSPPAAGAGPCRASSPPLLGCCVECACCSVWPRSPSSLKPAEMMMAARVPRSPSSPIRQGTVSAGVAIVRRCGLTSINSPANPARRRFRATTAPTEPGRGVAPNQRYRLRFEELVEVTDRHRHLSVAQASTRTAVSSWIGTVDEGSVPHRMAFRPPTRSASPALHGNRCEAPCCEAGDTNGQFPSPRRTENQQTASSTLSRYLRAFFDGHLLRFLAVFLAGDRGFESISLQRRVMCKPDFPIRQPARPT